MCCGMSHAERTFASRLATHAVLQNEGGGGGGGGSGGGGGVSVGGGGCPARQHHGSNRMSGGVQILALCRK